MNLLLILTSCGTSSFDNEKDINEYINDSSNGLYKEQTSNNIDFRIIFRPSDQLMLNEIKSNHDDIDSLRDNYHKYYYFILEMSKNGKEILEHLKGSVQYSEVFQSLSFQLPTFIYAETSNGKNVALTDFYYNPTYGVSSVNQILLVFERSAFTNSDELILTVKDFGLETGILKFDFEIEDLEEVPPYNFN